MRVAMYYSVQDIRIEEMPVPSIGPGDTARIGSTFSSATRVASL